jgi:hypothetical protein
MAIMGERGIGKSSLLRKFEDIAKQQGCVTVRRELDATVNSIQTLVVFVLQALKAEGSSNLPMKLKARDKIERFFSTYKLDVSLLGSGVGIEKIGASVALQDSFHDELMRIWKSIQNNVPAIVFLLDEAERIQQIEGAWSFLRSVLTRVSEDGGRYMALASGKLGLFKGIKEIFSPIERFLTPLEVKPMSLEEVKETLDKPLVASSRAIDDEAIERVHELSAGHPYVVQTFGFYAFEDGSSRIDRETIERLLPRVIARLSSQLFRDRFESASKAEKCVLLAMSEIGSATSPKEVARKSNLSEKSVPKILERLVNKSCISKAERGKYTLFNPLFGEYVRGVTGA